MASIELNHLPFRGYLSGASLDRGAIWSAVFFGQIKSLVTSWYDKLAWQETQRNPTAHKVSTLSALTGYM